MITLLALTAPAAACGGFFCNNVDPVDQSGEEIVFGVEDNVVTTHVKIAYSGPGEDFAWVLPVPGVPEMFISTDLLFDVLRTQTQAVPYLGYRLSDSCGYNDSDADSDADSDSDTDTDFDTDSGTSGGVNVLSEVPVGPYDTAVIQATSSVALVDWLQANGYGVPDSLAGNIDPYLAGGMNFLALKLQKDGDTGDLQPLGLRWPGDRASIPLQLTGVAATPDMPLTVYLLGEHRAVPLSYLHVQLNPFSWNWFGDGLPHSQRLARASDEAGGRAFATTFAGPNEVRIDGYYGGTPSTDGLASLTDPLEWFEALAQRGFIGNTELLGILRVHVPAPAGVDETAFYNDPNAYAEAWDALSLTFDPVLATADLDAKIVEPREQATELLDGYPYLTRLETVISPDEMTVDPVFGFNPDLPDVSRFPEGTVLYDCGVVGGTNGARRELTVPGNYTWQLPPVTALGGRSTSSWLEERVGHVATIVEQLSESGPGEILTDYTNELVERQALDPNGLPWPAGPTLGGETRTLAGCGCQTGDLSGIGLGVGLLLVTVARRRARRSSSKSTIGVSSRR